MAHFPKVSASIDYILLCILVFDRAAPLPPPSVPQCIVPHYPALSHWPASQFGISFKNKVSALSQMFWQLTPGRRNYNINTDNNYFPSLKSWLIYNSAGSNVGLLVRRGLSTTWEKLRSQEDSHNLCYLQLRLLLYLGIITKCTSRSPVHCYPTSNSEITEGREGERGILTNNSRHRLLSCSAKICICQVNSIRFFQIFLPGLQIPRRPIKKLDSSEEKRIRRKRSGRNPFIMGQIRIWQIFLTKVLRTRLSRQRRGNPSA